MGIPTVRYSYITFHADGMNVSTQKRQDTKRNLFGAAILRGWMGLSLLGLLIAAPAQAQSVDTLMAQGQAAMVAQNYAVALVNYDKVMTQQRENRQAQIGRAHV